MTQLIVRLVTLPFFFLLYFVEGRLNAVKNGLSRFERFDFSLLCSSFYLLRQMVQKRPLDEIIGCL